MSLIPLGILAASGAGGGGSFEFIASATGTGSSGTITFNSIPSTYQHLQLRIHAQDSYSGGASANTISVRPNGDSSSSNYTLHRLLGTGTNVYANGFSSGTADGYYVPSSVSVGSGSNLMGVGIVDILDYNSSTKNKTGRWFSGWETNNVSGAEGTLYLGSSVWLSTAAITSLSCVCYYNFTTKTTISLYGIKGA